MLLRRGLPLCRARPLIRSLSSTVRASHNRFHDRRDTEFVLHELEGLPRDGDSAAIIDSCEAFVAAWHHVDPLLDRSPPELVPSTAPGGRNTVSSHPEMKRLMQAFREQGFAEIAELGLPFAVQMSATATLCSAFTSNPLGLFVLTRCAADLLEAHGSRELKEQYLGKMRSAEWHGTMALSEPHAGSSLATIRTTATPVEGAAAAGEYRIRGDKMWTTGAFHDLSDNIIHMLLARTVGAPSGAAGISLFLVPNVLPDGSANDVELVSLNKKMGHHAITNCAWSLGERSGGAVGYLVGPEHGGLGCMVRRARALPMHKTRSTEPSPTPTLLRACAAQLHMMNAMRIEVGMGATLVGRRGLLESLLYAQEREQGGRQIIDHDDVKRMLLQQKAYVEGSHALCIAAAALHDRSCAGDREARALLEVQTEIVKSWPSEWCLEANKLAIQVMGGDLPWSPLLPPDLPWISGDGRRGLRPGLPSRATVPRQQAEHDSRGHRRHSRQDSAGPQSAGRPSGHPF